MTFAPDRYAEHDPRFRSLVTRSAPIEILHDGCRWAEGPVWLADAGCLVWSDIPNDRMLRWCPGQGTGVFRAPAGYANGNTRDRRGRLVTCQHGTRSVTRTEPDGSLTTLADRHDGRRLNSPNDVVVKSDGTVWFTDPTYGILSDYEGYRAEPEQDGRHVYRIDPDGGVTRVADDFVQPNGLAFDPVERHLYIADSGRSHDPDGPAHIRRFTVTEDNSLTGGAVFAEIDAGVPDGFRFDSDGRLWTSAGDGVRCYDPDGTLLGRILMPVPVANLCFGGPRRTTLFIAATHMLCAVQLGVAGAQRP